MKDFTDTITAISTPPGTGGIAIVRLSGPAALAVCERVFVSASGQQASRAASHTVHYGHVRSRGGDAALDEVLLTVMRAPRTYTREDVVEINCHGGPAAARAVLRRAVEEGARLAGPGEFTRRAFLNGRIDLTQAEAVLDLIRARTESFLRVSAHHLRGELTSRLGEIRESLMAVYIELEAVVNFPEDETEGQTHLRASAELRAATGRVERLIASAEQGRIMRDGLKIVICGKPNVGKSSLLNRLLRQERAIVSNVAGTTRDTVEESAQIGGVPVQLVDTAGVLEPRDLIEREAVRRSRAAVESADLILLVLDGGRPFDDEDRTLLDLIGPRKKLVVMNKCDQPQRRDLWPGDGGDPPVRVSALKGTGMEELQGRMISLAAGGGTDPDAEVCLSNLRHVESLECALRHLRRAAESLSGELSPEFVCEDIRRAVRELDRITGRECDQDLLDRIFSEFCIGK